MAKRFTDSEKWKREWFCELSLKSKLIWIYLLDQCDHSGIWNVNLKLMSFQLGTKISLSDILDGLGTKVELYDDKIFIPSFLDFQYGALRDNNSVHNSVLNRLRSLGIEINPETGFSSRPSAIMARLSKKKKLEVIVSDCFKCTYCGTAGDESTLVVDHIVPRFIGGGNEDHNLTTACVSCNSRKSGSRVGDFIAQFKLESTLSPSLLAKIDTIKTLNTPIKTPQGAKDKEEEEDKDKAKEILPSKKGDASKLPPLAELWNERCGTLPKVVGTNAARDRRIKERMQEATLAEWAVVIDRIAASDFCNGKSPKAWRADFDWLLQPEVRLKVMENKYANRDSGKSELDAWAAG